MLCRYFCRIYLTWWNDITTKNGVNAAQSTWMGLLLSFDIERPLLFTQTALVKLIHPFGLDCFLCSSVNSLQSGTQRIFTNSWWKICTSEFADCNFLNKPSKENPRVSCCRRDPCIFASVKHLLHLLMYVISIQEDEIISTQWINCLMYTNIFGWFH